MKHAAQNGQLKLTCPHCRHEHVVVGVYVDNLRDCLCPLCGGFCEIYAMDHRELRTWLHGHTGGGEHYA